MTAAGADDVTNAPAIISGTPSADTPVSGLTGTGRNAWWKFTAPADGRLDLDTTRSHGSGDLDTIITVYDASLIQIDTDDDSGGVAFTSYLYLPVTSGATYYVEVSCWDSEPSTLNYVLAGDFRAWGTPVVAGLGAITANYPATNGPWATMLVGSPPHWSDSSDASYTHVVRKRVSGSGSYASYASADVQATGADPFTAVDVGWRLRASTPTVPEDVRVDMTLVDSVDGTKATATIHPRPDGGGVPITADGTIREYADVFRRDSYNTFNSSVPDLLMRINNGTIHVEVTTFVQGGPASGEWSADVYELEVYAYPEGTVAPPPTVAGFYMPTRLFPRHRSQQQSGRWSAGSYH